MSIYIGGSSLEVLPAGQFYISSAAVDEDGSPVIYLDRQSWALVYQMTRGRTPPHISAMHRAYRQRQLARKRSRRG